MLLLRAVSYGPGSGYEGWCTTNSVAKRNLTDLHDLWDTDRPAHGLNGTVSPSTDSLLPAEGNGIQCGEYIGKN